MAASLALGLRSRRKASRGLEEYFLAGRNLPGWQAGLSMAATQFGADTPLLATGLVATAGIFALWRLWVYALAFLLLGFLLAPAWRRAGVVTDAELAELRYGGRAAAWLRGVKAIYFGTVFNCTVLAMVLFAAKEIAEPFLPWHAWLPPALFEPLQHLVTSVGVPFARAEGGGDLWVRSTDNLISIFSVVGVTWLYSATGGLRSVVQTDVLQLALMLLGSAGYAGWAVSRAGGLHGMLEQLRALYPPGGPSLAAKQILAFTPDFAPEAGGMLLLMLSLQWLVQMNADGTGYLAQRTMACRSDRDARIAALVFTGTQIVLRSLLWLPIAVALLVIYPGAAGQSAAMREATFVRGMHDLLPPGLLGLLVTAMLAALASTVDTHLNWGASYWTRDLYERIWMRGIRGREADPRRLVHVARLSNFVILALSLAIMTQLDSIQTAWRISLLLGAGMGGTLVLRWIWWRINAWGELAAAVVSLLLAPLLLATMPDSMEAGRLLAVALLATVAAIVTSLLTPAEDLDHLRNFYERVRPPGFWGPVGSNASLRRLRRGLLATAAGSVSCFALLVGAGTWLLESPVPFGLARTPWVTGLLALAAAATPVWWRLGGLHRPARRGPEGPSPDRPRAGPGPGSDAQER